MSDGILLCETADGVAHLTLNQPDRLNALSDDMIARLQQSLDELAEDRDVRVIIIRGAGKAFCAGHDLREMTLGRQEQDGGASYFADLFERCATLMQTIPRQPQPVIAEVHGIATAAGCQLVATCDLAVAADTARFGVNGVNIGLFCSTPMVALSRNIPRKKAFELLTTGEFLSAQDARQVGLVNRVVPEEDLQATSLALAETLVSKLGSAVRIGKQAFYSQLEMTLADAYTYTGQVMVENMLNRDTEEGIAAFLDKRPPQWPLPD